MLSLLPETEIERETEEERDEWCVCRCSVCLWRDSACTAMLVIKYKSKQQLQRVIIAFSLLNTANQKRADMNRHGPCIPDIYINLN